MPTMELQQFQYPGNVDVLDGIRAEMTPMYQRRIPSATKAGVQAVMEALWENPVHRNEFVDSAINLIGAIHVKYTVWTNVLAKFKKGRLQFGETVEELMVGIAEAKQYSLERTQQEQDIFGNHPLKNKGAFYKRNRENYYPVSLNQIALQRAFYNEGGISTYIAGQMASVTTGDQVDEFELMASLFKEYSDGSGFYNVNVPDLTYVPDPGAAEARQFLVAVKEMTSRIQFVSDDWNAAKMYTVAQPDELELFITPRAQAVIDVEALSAAFNLSKAEVTARTTVIPEDKMNIPGTQAILTTRDFFQVYDTVMEMTSQFNPVTLTTNMFWHHQGIIAASPFPPAIRFSTDPSTQEVIYLSPVDGAPTVTFTDNQGNDQTTLTRGETYQINTVVPVNTASLPADYQVANDGATLYLLGNNSSRTQLIRNEYLVVGYDESAANITVHAEATDDPSFQSDTVVALTGAFVGGGITQTINEDDTTITNTALPKISVPSGGAAIGASLTVDPGKWDTRGITPTYVWRANGTAISGATSDTYTIQSGDAGKSIDAVVTATKTGFTSGTATANAITVQSA